MSTVADPTELLRELDARQDELLEQLDKLNAICMVCGGPASRTQRLVNGKPAAYDDPVVIVGAQELYEARCRHHHNVPRKKSQGSPA